MTSIYDQHATAFARVSGYVILKDGERVATVAFKFPADGAGRLYAYVHWFGTEMVRGFAAGGGYDKRSAAVAAASRKLDGNPKMEDGRSLPIANNYRGFVAALQVYDGHHWNDRLRDAGFTVVQAI